MTRRPEPPRRLEVDQGLRRGPVVLPVALVTVPDAAQVDRKGRIPVRHPQLVGDAGIGRHEVPVGADAGRRHDARQHELRRRLRQPVLVRPHVVVEHDAGARLHVEVARCPGIQPDRRGRARRGLDRFGRRGSAVVQDIEAGHDGVWDGSTAGADRVGHVGEDGQAAGAQPLGRHRGCHAEVLVDDAPACLYRDPRRALHRSHVYSVVLQSRHPAQPVTDRRGIVEGTWVGGRPPREEQVDAARHAQLPLQRLQRDEHGRHGRLGRTHRELAHPARIEHPRDVEPQRAGAAVTAPQQRVGRHLRRPLHREQERLTGGDGQFRRERRAHERATADGSAVPDAVEPPEPLIDAVDGHAGRATARGGVGDDAVEADQRNDERAHVRAGCGEVVGDRRPHEAGSLHDDISRPEACQCE